MLALVVMDGNEMGKKIRKLEDDGHFRRLKAFSNTVNTIINETLEQLISEIEYVEDEINFIRPIIVGGDDICFIIKAKYGLDFTSDMIEIIRNESRGNELFGNGIEMSAGIVFMKYNFPFNIGRRIADSLLKSAKKKSVENNGIAMADFHIMHSASADNIGTIRKNEYTENISDETYYLTRKPYSLTEMKAYKARLKCLKKPSLAGNKLKSIREIVRLGRETDGVLGMLRIASKMKEKDAHLFFMNFIDDMWIKTDKGYTTDLLDLVEMADLTETGKRSLEA